MQWLVACCYRPEEAEEIMLAKICNSINEAIKHGIRKFGENRLQEAEIKYKDNINKDKFQKYVMTLMSQIKKSKKLMPPQNLKLMIDCEGFKGNMDISSEEFDVLKIITEYSRVKDIYENCALYQFQISNALISLR